MPVKAPPAKAEDQTKATVDAVMAAIKPELEGLKTGMNEIREKAAQVQRFIPAGIVGGIGKDSQPYSYIRAAALATGRMRPEDAKYEHDVAIRMKAMYGKRGVGFENNSQLVPYDTASVAYYSQAEDQDAFNAARELRLRVKAFDMSQVDPNIRLKSIGGNSWANTLNDADGGILRGFPTLGDLIELQRNQEVWTRLGAQEISLPPNGMMVLPKQTGGTVAYWANESRTVTQSMMNFGKLELQGRKLFVLSTLTGEMIRFVNPNVEAMLRTDMAVQASLAADTAMFTGSSNDRIKGLLTYETQAAWSQGSDKLLLYPAGVVGADGDVFQPDDADNMMALLPDVVANEEGRKWVMRRDLFAKIRNRRADAAEADDSRGPYLFDITRSAADKGVEELRGYPVIRSSQVPNNRAKGSATNLTIALHGYFPDWIIGRLGVMEFLASNTSDTAIANDVTIVRGIQYIDAGARHAASFVLCDTLIVQ